MVGGDHPFADSVQHRLALLEQRRDLARLEAEGLPLDPAREQDRTERSEREPDRRRDQEHRQVVAQLRADAAREQADRHEPDHVSRLRRGPAPSRASSGRANPSGRRRTRVPSSASLGSVETRWPIFCAVGVGVADALLVRDDDERRARPDPDPLGDRVDDPLRVRRRRTRRGARGSARRCGRSRATACPTPRSSWARAWRIETATPVPSVRTMIASCSRRICVDSRRRPQPHRRSRAIRGL